MIIAKWKLHSTSPDFLCELSATIKSKIKTFMMTKKTTRNTILTVNTDTNQYHYQSSCMCVKLLELGVLCLSFNMLWV